MSHLKDTVPDSDGEKNSKNLLFFISVGGLPKVTLKCDVLLVRSIATMQRGTCISLSQASSSVSIHDDEGNVITKEVE